MGIYSLRKEFAPTGANSFLPELIPIEKGGKNENNRVASPEHANIKTGQTEMVHKPNR